MKPRSHALLNRDTTVVVLIDLQEPFLRKIHNRDYVLSRNKFVLNASALLDIPIVATTQYGERMGPLLPEIATMLPEKTPVPVDKLIFSAAGVDKFSDLLSSYDREQILICGVETHICVLQTALDLALLDYQVHVAPDAVSSRNQEDHMYGLEKMKMSGIRITSTEGAVMEMLHQAGTDDFKAILKLIR